MNISPEIVEKINQTLTGIGVLKQIGYKIETIQTAGTITRCFCPIHKETIFRSMTLDDEAHSFKCAYTLCPGHRGGTLLEFYSMATGANQETAILHWVQELKLAEALPHAEDLASELEKKAEELLVEKNIDSAIPIYKQLIHLIPDRIDFQEKLAELYETNNDPVSATEQYLGISKNATASINYDIAEKSLLKAITLSPESDGFYQDLLSLYILQNKISQAVEILRKQLETSDTPGRKKNIFDKLISLEPNNIEWLQARSSLDKQLGNTNGALSGFEEILQIQEENKAYKDACVTLEKLISIQPENISWKNRLIFRLIDAGEKDKGLKQALSLIQKYKSNKDYKSGIIFLNQLKPLYPEKIELDEILIDLLVSSGQQKDAVVLLERSAEQAFLRNQGEQAIQFYQKALSYAPERVDLSRRLIQTYVQLGKREEAAEQYSKLAEYHIKKRELEQAISLHIELLQIIPEDSKARTQLAVLFEDNINAKNAIEQYLILIDQHIKGKKYTEAEKLCLKILQLDNENIDARLRLIDIYRITKNTDKEIETRFQLAKIYQMNGSIYEAARMCRIILKQIPVHIQSLELLTQIETRPFRKASYLRQLGNYYYKQKNYNLAANLYRLVIQIASDNLLSLERLAESLRELKAPAGEIKKIYLQLTELFIKQQQNSHALEILHEIQSIDPEDLDILRRIVHISEKLNKQSPDKVTKEQLIKQMYELAKLYESQNENDTALELYQKVLEQNPSDMDILVRVANIHRNMNNIDDALRAYESLSIHQKNGKLYNELTQTYLDVLSLAPQNSQTRENLAELYLTLENQSSALAQFFILAQQYQNKNDIDSAIKVYARLLEIQTGNVELSIRLSKCYSEKKNIKKALATLQSAADRIRETESHEDILTLYTEMLQIDPQNITTHEKLAKLFLSMNREQEAMMEYDVLASTYRQQGKLDLAIQTYLTILNIDPSNLQIRIVIADTHAQKGLTSEAIAQYFSIAQSFIKSDNWGDILPLLQHILEIDPHNTKAQVLLADAYLKTDNAEKSAPLFLTLARQSEKNQKWSDAIMYWEKLTHVEENQETALEALIHIHNHQDISNQAIPFYLKLSEILNQKQEYKRSRELLEEVFGLDPLHKEIRTRLINEYIRAGLTPQAVKTNLQVAILYFERNSFAESEHFAKDTLEIDAENLEARYLLIKIFLKTNRETEAVTEYVDVAEVLLEKNAYDQAIKAYQAALQLYPTNTKIHQMLIDTLIKADKQDEAIVQYIAMANAHIQKGTIDKALAIYKLALKLDPKNLSLRSAALNLARQTSPPQELLEEYLEVAELYFQKQDIEKGWQLCTEVFKNNPTDMPTNKKLLQLMDFCPPVTRLVKYYAHLNTLFLRTNQLQEAVYAGEKALEIDKNNTKVMESVAQSYIKSNSPEKALLLYRSLAEIYALNSDIPKALKCYAYILSLDPNDIDARKSYIETHLQQGLEEEIMDHYLALGDAYMRRQQFDEALAVLDKIMRIDPTNADAFARMQLFSETQEKWKKSQLGKTTTTAKSPPPVVEAKANDTISTKIDGYLRTLEINPSNFGVRKKLINAYLEKKKLIEAKEQYFILADTYATQEQYEEAIKTIDEYLVYNPNDATAIEKNSKFNRLSQSLKTLKSAITENDVQGKNKSDRESPDNILYFNKTTKKKAQDK